LSEYGDFQNKIQQHGTIRQNGPILPDSTPPWPSPPSPKKEIYGGLSGPFFFWLPSDKNLLKKKKKACMRKGILVGK
jgi:hypothetical protein